MLHLRPRSGAVWIEFGDGGVGAKGGDVVVGEGQSLHDDCEEEEEKGWVEIAHINVDSVQ